MNIAIILSGGVGSRMGLNLPKQYVMVNNQPIINYCLTTFLNKDNIDAVVIVVADQWKDFVVNLPSLQNTSKSVLFAQPGETRQYSIFNALKVVESAGYAKDDIVIVHDAARPLVSSNLIDHCIESCQSADAVMPVIPVKDTVYYSKDASHIDSLLERSHLWAGQAPEAFVFGKYLQAHKNMPEDELLQINGSTEIAYKVGLKCKLVKGDAMNFKITTPEDLSNFEVVLKNSK